MDAQLVTDRIKVTGTPAKLRDFHKMTGAALDRSGWGRGGAVFYNCIDANWRHVLAAARQTKVSVAVDDYVHGFIPVVDSGVACRIPITDGEVAA